MRIISREHANHPVLIRVLALLSHIVNVNISNLSLLQVRELIGDDKLKDTELRFE
jgi:hypothetical protein